MEVQDACFNEFPYQCVGCSEYTETRQYQAAEITLLAGLGNYAPLPHGVRIIKECRRFHKRKVEYKK